MRHLISARRAGVLVVAAAGGLLLSAGPALADVTVSPPSAPQGAGADLTFRVSNTAQAPITRVRLVLPADSPVAEVYPLSVPDWAPQITQRTLSTPLETIHGGTPVTRTARDITWIAMAGRSLAPGRATDLSVSLGPLPTLSRMRFTVIPTYANGRTGPAMPPADLQLTPAAPGQESGQHAGHAGATGTDAADPDADYFARTVAQAGNGPSVLSIAGWIVAAVIAAGAVVAVLRARRRATDAAAGEAAVPDGDEVTRPDDAATPAEGKEAVGASAARVTSWTYRDGPAG